MAISLLTKALGVGSVLLVPAVSYKYWPDMDLNSEEIKDRKFHIQEILSDRVLDNAEIVEETRVDIGEEEKGSRELQVNKYRPGTIGSLFEAKGIKIIDTDSEEGFREVINVYVGQDWSKAERILKSKCSYLADVKVNEQDKYRESWFSRYCIVPPTIKEKLEAAGVIFSNPGKEGYFYFVGENEFDPPELATKEIEDIQALAKDYDKLDWFCKNAPMSKTKIGPLTFDEKTFLMNCLGKLGTQGPIKSNRRG